MASISATDSAGKFRVTLTVTESSYSVENNNSVVAWSFGIESLGRGGFASYGIPRSAVVNGETVVNSSASTSCLNNNSTSWGSGTKTIGHDLDGTKTISFSFSAQGLGDYSWSGTISKTGTLALTATPRASTIELDNTSLTISNTSATLTYTATSQGNFYHKLSWMVDNAAGYFIWSAEHINNTTKSGSINTGQILQRMPTTTSASVQFVLETYSDSGTTNLVGRSYASCQVEIDTTSIKPSLVIGTIGPDSTPISGKLIAGNSTANLTVSATNSSGAIYYTMRFSTTKGSLVSTSSQSSPTTITTKTLPASTTNYTFKITITITDSRGVSVTGSKTSGTVYAYAPPVISAKFYRTATNSSVPADPAGEYVYRLFIATQSYTVGGSNTSLSVVGKQNGSTVSSGTWGSLSENSTATLIVTATDAVSSATKTLIVGTAKFPIDLYDDGNGSVGVGFGITAEGDKIKSSLPLVMNNNAGIKNTDSGGNEMFMLNYNGSNLWVGARTSNMTHFLGKTYICTGYNSSDSAGNESIFISVPNSANDGVTYYRAYHEGFDPYSTFMTDMLGFNTATSWTSGTHDANSAPDGLLWINCNYVSNLPYSSGNGMLLQIAHRLQFFVRHNADGATYLHVRLYTNSQWYPWTKTALA